MLPCKDKELSGLYVWHHLLTSVPAGSQRRDLCTLPRCESVNIPQQTFSLRSHCQAQLPHQHRDTPPFLFPDFGFCHCYL